MGLDAPGEHCGKGGGFLAFVDNLNVLDQFIEAVHDALGEVETHFSVALLECSCEGL